MKTMKTPSTVVTCKHCGESFDIAEGNGVSDENGFWAHEECQDAYDELVQNELDQDPIALWD